MQLISRVSARTARHGLAAACSAPAAPATRLEVQQLLHPPIWQSTITHVSPTMDNLVRKQLIAFSCHSSQA